MLIKLNMFIKCENLVKVFNLADDVELIALQGLDLEIEQGEMVGIVGASGSGKSTLLNVLGGLVRPTAGSAHVDGKNLLKMSDRDLDQYRRDQVGFVWQQSTRNLIPWLNAAENVAYPMLMAGQNRKVANQRAAELLQMVGLEDRADHRPETLSGGEQSRVAIAIALANNPTLLLADEPTGELDTATADMIYGLFRTLNKELGLTTLIVSHDPEIARQVDRVVSIRDGKLAGETVRSQPAAQDSIDGETAQVEEFEELTVLDAAGRLQIPKEMRDELGLGKRVRLEQTEDGVLIKPIETQNGGEK